MDIDEKIQELKRNVANQYQGGVAEKADGDHDPSLLPNLLEEDCTPVSSSKDDSGDALMIQNVAKDMKSGLSVAGSQMVASIIVSYALAWGVGHLFTLSSFSRIIIGALLAFSANGLTVYRMIKQ